MTPSAPLPAVGGANREHGPRILLVEDEPTIAITLGDALEDNGYHVTLLGDGSEALPCIDSEDFDAVISDLRLPGANGLEVLRHARQCHPNVRLLLVTAFAPADQQATLKELHAGLLAKPFANEAVLDWLDRGMAG